MPDFDMFTYTFPCKNISTIGKGEGFKKEAETQSSLLWECERIIREKKPKYLLMENVKNIVGKENLFDYNNWIDILKGIGYNSYWSVLDGQSFGVPQHRERVMMVSILKEHDDFTFAMPKNKKCNVTLKNILEDNVDKNYYINPLRYNNIIITNKQKILLYDKDARYKEITIEDYKSLKKKKFNDLKIDITKYIDFDKENVEYFATGISGYNLETLGGRVSGEENLQIMFIRYNYDVSSTLTTVQKDSVLLIKTNEGKLIARNFTPLECWRLQGLSDESFKKAKKAGLAKGKLYERASRGIVVPMLEVIFRNLFYNRDTKYFIGQSDNKNGIFF